MDKMKKIYYEGDIPNMELTNPPLKDTVIIPNRGYTIIRFFSDNPGFWAFHCHIEFHLGKKFEQKVTFLKFTQLIVSIIKIN